ncbi:unnamed protein product [Trichogramma brassicae]|uniref:Reverse transcriptase domain-containing protein n=1 Tax=Trichogramma brassicae TaxID=86971 RepID=A0A6H5IG08_9HYME|nr:unnamed protein product [Trichogramma brassicae]
MDLFINKKPKTSLQTELTVERLKAHDDAMEVVGDGTPPASGSAAPTAPGSGTPSVVGSETHSEVESERSARKLSLAEHLKRLNEKITEIMDFAMPRNNVHKPIKEGLTKALLILQSCYTALDGLEHLPRQNTVEKEVQTSPRPGIQKTPKTAQKTTSKSRNIPPPPDKRSKRGGVKDAAKDPKSESSGTADWQQVQRKRRDKKVTPAKAKAPDPKAKVKPADGRPSHWSSGGQGEGPKILRRDLEAPEIGADAAGLGNRKWSARTFDGDCFAEVVSAMNIRPGFPEDMVDELMSTIVRACDASMSRGGDRRRREPVYWWNDRIEECRRSCLRLRRRAQRARGHADETIGREEFADARRRLHRAIKASKRLCWRQLCDEADCDVWGKPYRVVMSRLRAPRTSPPSATELVQRAVSTLFPMIVPRPIDAPPLLEEHLIPEVGVEELRWAYGRVRIGAAPGPDGIPNIALKAAVEACFENFRRVFTVCLRKGCFPTRWKRQRLVLMLKNQANLPWNPPPTVRCACLIQQWQTMAPWYQGVLRHHHPRREERLQLGAVEQNSHRPEPNGGPSLSATNSVSSYFLDRVLEFTTDDSSETYEVTAGVPQGSVLGPILWNVMYDRILRLKLPRSAKIVGFADDIAVTVVAKHLDLVEFYSNETIRLVRAALTDLGLQTADQKTEVLLVTSRKVRETITLRAGDHFITSAPCIRYLGVHIDARLRFDEHLRIVSDKANRVAGALLGIMPNIGGPRSSRRRLCASVVDSILLYGAPAWSEAAKTHDYVRRAASIHRRACLRVICGFCSISHEASYVLASIPPLELLIDERSRLYHRRLENVGSEERARTIEKWQAQWARSTKGRWTHRLIPNIIPWIERRHGEANYHLTPLLTGHGCFRSYLCRTNNDTSDRCPACPLVVEDAEHVIFHCPRFAEERGVLHRLSQGPLEPETLVGFMLDAEPNWLEVSSFAHSVMTRRRVEERARRR